LTRKPCAGLHETRYTVRPPVPLHCATTEPPGDVSSAVVGDEVADGVGAGLGCVVDVVPDGSGVGACEAVDGRGPVGRGVEGLVEAVGPAEWRVGPGTAVWSGPAVPRVAADSAEVTCAGDSASTTVESPTAPRRTQRTPPPA
jgi:hypothetical protein